MRDRKLNLPKIGLVNAVMLILVSLFKEVRILMPLHTVFQILLLVGIVLGGILIVYNFFINKEKTLFDYLCYGMMITLALSSILSPQWRTNSIKDTAVMGICVLSIFPTINQLELEDKNRFSLMIMRTLIIMITIISFASIVLFFINPYINMTLLGQEIEIGMSSNRLFGLYHSLTLPIAASSLILGIIFRLNPEYQSSIANRGIYMSNFVVNFLFVALSYSYGILASLAVTLIYISIFFLTHSRRNIAVSIIASVFVAVIFLGGVYGTRVVLFQIHNSDRSTGSIEDPDEPQLPDDVGKTQHYGILTGRDILWSFGFDNLVDRPLIGFGAGAFYGTEVLGTQGMQNFHNVFVQSLVGGGIIHSVFSFSVIGLIILRCLVYSFTKMNDRHYLYNLSIIGLLVFSVIGGLVETNFLYVNRFPQYIFWIALGLLTFNVTKHSKEQIS